MPTGIKSYVKPPLKKLFEAFQIRIDKCDVVLIDEIRTTKLCSCCYNVCITSKSPHRFQVCHTCKKVWNRDVNAAKNILYKMECKVGEIQPNLNNLKK